jgi:hypothetical protein
MRQYEIGTPYGDRYYIHANGDIERTDSPGFKCSGQWRFVALAYAEGRGMGAGHRAPVTLADLADGLAPATYKKGTPRYTVIDFDHGSHRVWGNTRAHGISWARRVLKEDY